MPWEIAFIRGNQPGEQPIGSRTFVVEQLSRVLPEARLTAPPPIPEEVRSRMPPVVVEAMSRRMLEAEFDHPDLLMQFYCADTDPIQQLNAEVRGDGDPIPLLKTICDSTGWSLWDLGNEFIVDLSQTVVPNWNEFCAWRNRGIENLNDED